MTTALLTHSACLYHEPPIGHPESPDRLRAVLHALEAEEFSYLLREEAPAATIEEIARVHPRSFVERVLAAIPGEDDNIEHGQIDADTYVSPGSREAALRAAGALIRAVDLVATGHVKNAFCAVRPPGHHAEPSTAMGFCLFNNVAVGAMHARVKHGLRRVAVVDFDVHHGNGTQASFWDDADAFFLSSHQSPLYPGTGAAEERGAHANILNLPCPPGTNGAQFRALMSDVALPAVRAFGPNILLISAGFDAHAADPLGQMRLTASDYRWITHELTRLAGDVCGGRIVSTLEGGYDLEALATSAAAHVAALMDA